MFDKLILVAAVVGAIYWYWTGPYQDRTNPSYEKRVETNTQNMRECIRGLNRQHGSTGFSAGDPKEVCSQRFNVYEKDGKWHSYEDVREGQ